MDQTYGLKCLSSRDSIPLKNIDTFLTVTDTIATVTSELTYENENDVAIETEFVFPVDDDSAVFQFEVDLDGRHIVGECQEKEQAEQTYQDAINYGNAAFMVAEDANAGDIFSMKLGNLPPRKTARITFSYVSNLHLDNEGAVNFVLPTMLNPRYNPSEEDGGVTKPVSIPKYKHGELPYTLHFQAQIKGQMKVNDVTSVSSEINWKTEEDGTTVVCFENKISCRSDLDLRIVYDDAHKPTLVLGRGMADQTGLLQKDVLMLNFFPEMDTSQMCVNSEFVFLVDRSGSMRGDKMKQAKQTLLLFLKSLPVGCFFNIICFGNQFSALFPESKEYNEESLNAALQLQETMDANMGGTEILTPLKYLHDRLKPKDAYSRQLFVLTDGEVSNTQAVVEEVRSMSGDTRVFSFGVGEGASTSLVKGIARAGNGKAEFVKGSDRIREKVMSSLKLALQPTASDISVQWHVPNDVKVTTLPEKLPVVFAGAHLVIYGVLSEKLEDIEGVSATLTGKLANVTFLLKSETLHVTLQDTTKFPLHRLAAKTQLKQLELSDNARNSEAAGNIDNQIKLLSLAANIVSKYTSFVGVDTETKRKVKLESRSALLPAPERGYCRRATMSRGAYGAAHGARGRGVALSHAMAAGTLRNQLAFSSACHPSMPCQQSSPLSGGALGSAVREKGGWGGGAAFSSAFHPSMAVQCQQQSPLEQARMSDGALDAARSEMEERGAYSQQAIQGNNFVPQFRKKVASPSVFNPRTACQEVADCMDTVEDSLFETIISLQSFSGHWVLNDGLAQVVRVELGELMDKSPVQDHRIWATVLALVWLKQKQADKAVEWAMISAKAELWLQSVGIQPPHTVDSLMEAAADICK